MDQNIRTTIHTYAIRRIDVRTLERPPSGTYTEHVAQILRFETRR